MTDVIEWPIFKPKYVFFTKGKGIADRKLRSFEMALRDAGIQKFNLVNVSSILPPHTKEISRAEGLAMLHDGQVVFAVIARESTDEPKSGRPGRGPCSRDACVNTGNKHRRR